MKCVCAQDSFFLTLVQILCISVCVYACHVPVFITFFVTSPNGQIVSHPNTRWLLPSLDTEGWNPLFHTIIPTYTHASTPLFKSFMDHSFMGFHARNLMQLNMSHTYVIMSAFIHAPCVNTTVHSCTVHVKKGVRFGLMWVDMPEDCSVLHQPCLLITLPRSLIWRSRFPL